MLSFVLRFLIILFILLLFLQSSDVSGIFILEVLVISPYSTSFHRILKCHHDWLFSSWERFFQPHNIITLYLRWGLSMRSRHMTTITFIICLLLFIISLVFRWQLSECLIVLVPIFFIDIALYSDALKTELIRHSPILLCPDEIG